MARFTLKARFIFPVAAPPIADGAVIIDDKRISAVGRFASEGDVRDFGNAAIIPGLVNAHAHLDFSDLKEPIGQPGIGMADWIRKVIAHRRNSPLSPKTVLLGLSESARYGVTTIGDIVQAGSQAETLQDVPLNVTAFQELIAPTSKRVAGALQILDSLGRHAYMNLQPGLSPHSPYTVHPELLAAAISVAKKRKYPLAMHLAESADELELLRSGGGPLRNLLNELDAWDPSLVHRNSRPIDYLRLLSSAPKVLIVHGNYLDDEEIAFLAKHAATMTVAYCPRTSHWFGRKKHPLEEMLAAGAAVSLGTDGRSSSPDLNLLAEMQFVAKNHSAVAPSEILKMGTLQGANALGWQWRTGTIEPGKQADLTVIAIPDRDAADPHELLFDPDAKIAARYWQGQPSTQ